MDMGSGDKRVRCMERVTWKLTSPYVKNIAKGNLLYGSGNSNRGSISISRDGTGRETGARFKREGIYVYLEKAMAPHSSTLAWKIPRTEEPGRLQSMGS